MPVGVNSPGAYKSPVESIMEGLNVAANIYGIKEAKDKHQALLAESEKAKKQEEIDNAIASASDTEYLKGTGLDVSKLTNKENAGYKKIYAEEKFKNMLKPPEDTTKKGLEIKKLEAEIAKINADANKTRKDKSGKLLPATEVQAIGSADSAIQALEDAKKVVADNANIVGPAAGILNKVLAYGEIGEVGKKSKEIEAQLQLNAQILGKYLEGGKLAENDIQRYRNMLPNGKDSADAIERKTILIAKLVRQKQQADLNAYGNAGYDISGFNQPQEMTINVPQPKQQASYSHKDLNSMTDEELMALHNEVVSKPKVGANK